MRIYLLVKLAPHLSHLTTENYILTYPMDTYKDDIYAKYNSTQKGLYSPKIKDKIHTAP